MFQIECSRLFTINNNYDEKQMLPATKRTLNLFLAFTILYFKIKIFNHIFVPLVFITKTTILFILNFLCFKQGFAKMNKYGEC